MTKKKYENIYWIFNHTNPAIIPSYFVSGIMPANQLEIKKVIFLKEHDPEYFLNKLSPRLLIISKVFDNSVQNLVKIAKKRNIKIISIFDDWNFDNEKRNELNLPIALHSTAIVSKTKYSAIEIEKNIKLSPIVIPDPVRFKGANIFKDIRNPLNLCWFGTHTNHDTILGELSNLDNIGLKIDLNIITNFIEEIKEKIRLFKIKNINFIYTTWTVDFYKHVLKSDIVLLPYPNDKERLIKSSNRIIDSINLGRFTILSKVNQFEEFKDFVYFGNVSDGIKWVLKNIEKAKKMTHNGQQYINKNYTLDKICELWSNLFNNLKN